MANTDDVRAGIDGQIKEAANKVLAQMDLSVSDAIQIPLTRVSIDRRPPLRRQWPSSAIVPQGTQALQSQKHR